MGMLSDFAFFCGISFRVWAMKWVQPRKFAVCGPPQLQQVGVCSRVFGQAAARWLPAHLTHLGE